MSHADRRRHALRAFAVFLGSLVGACGASGDGAGAGANASADGEPAASAGGEGAGAAPPNADPGGADGDALEVEREKSYVIRLLDRGATPRRALRFDVPEGAESSASMLMSQRVSMRLGGQALPEQPPIRTRAVMGFGPVARDGAEHTIPWRLAEIEVLPDDRMPPAVQQQIADSMAGLAGLGGTYVVDGQGRVISSETDYPPGLDPAARRSMASFEQGIDKILIVFPESALGTGAVWEITQQLTEPIRLEQTVRHRLTALDGERLAIDSRVVQRAGPQTMSNPGGGPPFELDGMRGNGRGTNEVFLDRVVGTSEVGLTVAMEGHVDAQGQVLPMELETGVEMEIAPKE